VASCSAVCCFFFQAEDGIRDATVTGVQTCALPILEIGETVCNFSKSPKWLVPSLPRVGEVYLAMCCVKMSRGRKPFTRSAPMLRSEERRVGKEWTTWRATETQKEGRRGERPTTSRT